MNFDKEHLENVYDALILFNEQKFWECHEELEHYWLEGRGDPVRDVYWAIIQLAASLFHFREKNLTGAQGMLHKALDKFEKCEKNWVESPLLEKALNWKELKKRARSIPRDSKIDDFFILYEFKFPDPRKWNQRGLL